MINWLNRLNRTAIRVEHDLAEQHVLESQDGLRVVDGVKTLKRFVKVGISGLEIFLFCV